MSSNRLQDDLKKCSFFHFLSVLSQVSSSGGTAVNGKVFTKKG